jgi:hypothetical protein
MRILGWILLLFFWSFLGLFFWYTLPQKDIVTIQGTEILRQDFSGWNRMFYAQADAGGADNAVNRDLRLINATRENGNVIVYRNEDTGLFGWPPYFKITASDVQAEAQAAISTSSDPKWYLVTHYGWRLNAPTIYPNIIRITPIESPAVGKPIPWLNYLILGVFAFVYISIWTRWRRFRKRRLDPAFEEIQDNLEGTGDAFAARRRAVGRWVKSFRD